MQITKVNPIVTTCSIARQSGPHYGSRLLFVQRIAAILLAFGLVFSVTILPISHTNANAADQQIYQAVYSVDYDGLRLGTSQRNVFITDDGSVVSRHSLRPEGLALLLGEVEYTDTAQVHIGTEHVSLLAVQRASDKSSDSYTATFHWDKRSIEFSDGSVLAMPDHAVHDFESWLMLLMVAPAQHRDGSIISILERKDRLRTYQIQQLDNDFVTIEGQSYETVRFRLQSVDNPSRAYVVWVAPEIHNIVVQIVKLKKSNELKFTITEFRDQTSSGN